MTESKKPNNSNRRTVAAITTSRADYSHLVWVLRALRDHPQIDLRLIAMAAQLSPEFGLTVEQIERDGLEVHERVECLLSSDTDVGMAKTIGTATLGLADTLGRVRPDVLLLIADRYELLAPASVALALRIPIAHIEGGEISEGAIDDAVRNALTKLAHLHFAPTEAARERVLAMGEEAWRVHRVGAPSLDHLTHGELPSRESLASELGPVVEGDALVVSYHPVTLDRDPAAEGDAMFAALEQLADRPIAFCFPNADAGSRELVERARDFCRGRAQARLFVNLPPPTFLGLLRHAAAMVGNSSSGIMETPSLLLPTVNVGRRQQGRERARNIIDAPAEADAIVAAVDRALTPEFRESLKGMTNPYGDGQASTRIAQILADCPGPAKLLQKLGHSPFPSKD